MTIAILCAAALAVAAAAPPTAELSLDLSRTGAEFEGIGAVSAGASSRLLIDYPEPARSRILDWLFLPKYGAAFQHLKVEVGGGINSTDGTEPTHARSREELDHPARAMFERGYEWWLMKEAKKRNPKIVLECLPWGAPGWIGNGDYFTPDMADYLVGFIQGAKRFHELDISLVGGWNERDVAPEFWKLLRRTLDTRGLAHVKIVGGDRNGPPEDQWKIAEQAAADPELASVLHAIGVHYPYGDLPPSVAKLRAQGVRTWSSEHGEWDWQTMQPFLYRRAASINEALLERGLTKVSFWSAVTSYYDCLPAPRSGVVTANTPWSGAFEIAPTLWAVAHYTQFAEPGWRFVEGVGRKLPAGGSVVGFVSPDAKDVSLVVETTTATADQVLKLRPAGPLAALALHVWRTDQMEPFLAQADLPLEDGVWTLALTPNAIYTVTTTTGQRKGDGRSPAPGVLPLPYRDDFDGYRPPATPRYWSDQGGTFEVVPRADGGQCLRQQVHRPGIDWSGATYAYSVVGDERWNDVEVSAQASFETLPQDAAARGERFVGVLARWHPGATWLHFKTPHPAGYQLRLFGDGRWQLTAARTVLAEGRTTAPAAEPWRTLRLACVGDRLTASLDGVVLADLRDSTYLRGLAGVSSRFHPACFDGVEVIGR